MKEDEFERLISRVESETLDFKQEGYDLENSRNTFIKDLLAMANTPRKHAAPSVIALEGWGAL